MNSLNGINKIERSETKPIEGSKQGERAIEAEEMMIDGTLKCSLGSENYMCIPKSLSLSQDSCFSALIFLAASSSAWWEIEGKKRLSALRRSFDSKQKTHSNSKESICILQSPIAIQKRRGWRNA